MTLLDGVVRVGSFFGKELREVVRRPGVLFSVVIGPFAILLLFGLGTTGFRDPFATEVVVPPGSELSRDPAYYEELVAGRLPIVGVTEDAAAAEQRLREGEIGLLIVVPENAEETLRNGERVSMRIAWNEVDPLANGFAEAITPVIVGGLNSEVIELVVSEGLAAADGEVPPSLDIDPEVVARPVEAETENIAPSEASVLNFYGPAVLALVIQHLGVSLTSLSLVRERRGGHMDRYRVAPVSASEILVGKGLAHGLVTVAVGAGVGMLLVGPLGVPAISGWVGPAIIIALLALASLGIGLVISLVADSEQQAVQLSMLLLLASAFLSGLVLPISSFAAWMEPLAYLLPVTHGIGALQETMLRGSLTDTWMAAALGIMAVGYFMLAVWLLRRALRSER
jgi:ABC-2 type transport system permease protein